MLLIQKRIFDFHCCFTVAGFQNVFKYIGNGFVAIKCAACLCVVLEALELSGVEVRTNITSAYLLHHCLPNVDVLIYMFMLLQVIVTSCSDV